MSNTVTITMDVLQLKAITEALTHSADCYSRAHFYAKSAEAVRLRDAIIGAQQDATVEPDGIFAGTMQGVANYLERLDRNAFATLRRAYEADGWTTKTAQRYAIEYLQIEWCNIGDAWRIAQKLVD